MLDFSIITPSYNYGHYIGDCLESVAIQQGATFEHIIFDAMSTDNTMEVVAKYPDVEFFQEPDKGMSEAINKGFKRAKGRWLMWLNADDKLCEDSLKTVLAYEKKFPKADVLYGAYNMISAEGKYLRRIVMPPFFTMMNTYYGPTVASTSAFYRRQTIIEGGHFLDESLNYAMDWEYYSRLGKAGFKFKYIPRVLADFRWHGENLSRLNYKKGTGMDYHLARQKQFAESRAVKRVYGIGEVNHEYSSNLIDVVLAYFFKILKGLSKLPYRLATKNCTLADS